MCQLTK